MYDASVVAVIEQSEELPHDSCCSCLVKIMLSFEYTCQRFALPVFDYYKKSMIAFEQFIYFRNGEVVNFFEFVDMFLKENSLVRADFILVDNINCSGHCGYFMDGFS